MAMKMTKKQIQELVIDLKAIDIATMTEEEFKTLKQEEKGLDKIFYSMDLNGNESSILARGNKTLRFFVAYGGYTYSI